MNFEVDKLPANPEAELCPPNKALRSRWHRIGGRVTLVIIAIGFSLLACEAFLRLEASIEFTRIAAWRRAEAERSVPQGVKIKLGHMVRLASEPDRVYELLPNQSYEFLGKKVRTNSYGFRGPEISPQRTPGSLRILGLGDSIMFGWGVEEEETYLSVLGSRLSERLDREVEIVNAAVPGYNSAMELATFESIGRSLSPDWVVVEYVGNDYGLPPFIRTPPKPLGGRSMLWNALRGVSWKEQKSLMLPEGKWDTGSLRELGEIPPEFRHLVGTEAVRRAYRRLAELSETHDFRVAVVCFAPDAVISTICRDEGFEMLVVHPLVVEYMVANEIERFETSEMVVPADGHPSSITHRIYADLLYQHLVESLEPGLGSDSTRE